MLVYRVGERRGEVAELDGELATLQKLMGGYIEEHRLSKFVGEVAPELVVLCNEDGRSHELPENRLGLLGTIVVARAAGGDWASLTAADVEAVRAVLDVVPDPSLN